MPETTETVDGRPCKTCQVWLPCELLDAVAQKADEMGVSDSQLVARALYAFLGLPEPSPEDGQCSR